VGDSDPLVPLAGGDVTSLWNGRVESRPPVAAVLASWAERLGLPPEPVVTSERDGVTVAEFGPGKGVEFVWVTVAGLGHHWPGGRGRLNPEVFGPPSDRLRANDRIWEFFRRHALD
jgi:polyhydroxybutyrate depolymerase